MKHKSNMPHVTTFSNDYGDVMALSSIHKKASSLSARRKLATRETFHLSKINVNA